MSSPQAFRMLELLGIRCEEIAEGAVEIPGMGRKRSVVWMEIHDVVLSHHQDGVGGSWRQTVTAMNRLNSSMSRNSEATGEFPRHRRR